MTLESIEDENLPQNRALQDGLGRVDDEGANVDDREGSRVLAEDRHAGQKSKLKKKKRFTHFVKKKVLHYRPIRGEANMSRGLKKLRLLDRACFLVIIVGYTVFCIVMFVRVELRYVLTTERSRLS